MMNQKMKDLLNRDEDNQSQNIDYIIKTIMEKVKLVNNCVIYDRYDRVQEDKSIFSKILKSVGDYTGYEMNFNEIIFSIEEIGIINCDYLAMRFLQILNAKYIDRKFFVFISVHDDTIELRFYTIREDENPWLMEDLDNYDDPIVCHFNS